ncbi:PREDICTED: kinesin-like protein KIF3A [Amphimedon queenslandica]|uniref:Kinesin-like protein n=1 Tax=Amphimedon queenslandica TaxID=400682 RepID=A0A1X7U3L6_AMPQE|nr:PREDICTED: kinesin-like protein KIF3A [Amphimedon queenslandica]|eukprot:XP_003389109.2 PREDICTED: kinesin-like protein KIF3A [Amphimedon queenslandica]
MAAGGGSVVSPKPPEETDNVRVAVRSRPLSQSERNNNHQSIVTVDQTRGEITIVLPDPKGMREPKKTFTFDSVFGADTTQADVYNETARPIVDAVLEGYNGTIFAYGQTGTGKTYTMAGENNPETRGIIPNSFAHIFGRIHKCEGETKFLVRVSYLEIYNEEVRDLLNKKSKEALKIRERPDVGVYVKDLLSFVVKDTEEMEKLMSIGNKNRAFGATDMNERSSRSHTIFSITVEQSQMGPDKKEHVRMGKLHLVDLAGSERLSKTGATGVRKDEAASINRSLTNLGIVISALVDDKSTHIPYRNSKLTRLLQDSLGGNSKTVMIANIGPADYNSDETLSTLRYADTAKRIKNKARINEDPKDAMLREFQKEIEKLKKMLAEEEREKEEEEGEEGEEGSIRRGSIKNKRKKKQDELSTSMSPREMAELKKQIEEERKKLLTGKDVAKEEKEKMEQELEKKEEELAKAQEEQAELQKRLSDLESKVIVGGVNLLEQTEKQEKLLEKSRKDLEKRKKKESILKEQLKQKEVERQDYQVKIANLQETRDVITHELKDTWKQLQSMKDELIAVQEEYQREKEYLLQDIRDLDKQVELQALIMNYFIPQEFQDLIEQHVQWDEEEQEWHLDGIAYAGNSIQREPAPVPQRPPVQYDTLSCYLSYNTERDFMFMTPDGLIAAPTVKSTRSKIGKNKSVTPSSSSKSKNKSSDTSVVSSESQYPTSRGLISRQKHFA